MERFTDKYYTKLHFGYFDLIKNLKYLTPNEQAFIISKYGRNMRYESIMEKFDLNWFQLNIIKHSAELKMTLLITKNLLPYQQKEVEELKRVIYPEITEEEYDNYVWDINEDITKAYFSGKFETEKKVETNTSASIATKSEEKVKEEAKSNSKYLDGRRKIYTISETDKQKIIEHLKYFKPLEQLCLIHTYQLFNEDKLTTIGIASKFNCGLKNVSWFNVKAKKVVEEYILSNNEKANEHFAEIENKGKIYESLTKDNYLTFNPEDIKVISKPKVVVKNQTIKPKNIDRRPKFTVQISETDKQKIIDKLKYFSTVKQLCLIKYYNLFGEDGLNFLDIAKRIESDPAFVSKHKIKAVDFVQDYILADNPNANEYFDYLDEIGATYTPLTKDTYLSVTKGDLEFEKNGRKKEFKPKSVVQDDKSKVVVEKTSEDKKEKIENAETNKTIKKEVDLQQIIDMLKYFSKAEQACLVYGYGLFGVKKGDNQALAKHFPKGKDLKSLMNRTVAKKRLLTKPLDKMTEHEYFRYQQILETVYDVNPESFYHGKTTANKENSFKNLILQDVNKLKYIKPKIQYVLLANSGFYDKKLSLGQIAENLGCNTNQISVYKAKGIKYLQILDNEKENFTEEERKIYNKLLSNNYDVLSKENFENFPKTIDRTKHKRGNMLQMPEYFDTDLLKHFPTREQVMFYLVYGINGINRYSLSKVAEAGGTNVNSLRESINENLDKMKIITSDYEELSDEDKKAYNSIKNVVYLEITKDNVFDFVKNKNSEIYFIEKGVNSAQEVLP